MKDFLGGKEVMYKFGKYNVSFLKNKEKEEYYLEIDNTERKTGNCLFWLTANYETMKHLLLGFQGILTIGLDIEFSDFDQKTIATFLLQKLEEEAKQT